MLDADGQGAFIGPSFEYPRQVAKVDRAMRELAISKWSPNADLGRPATCHRSLIHAVKLIRSCANVQYEDIKLFYSKHKLSPYFELLADEAKSFRAQAVWGCGTDRHSINEWVKRVRGLVKDAGFTRMLFAHERSARKNALSLKRYISRLHDLWSRLCVVRVDLAYRRAYREVTKEIEPMRVKHDLAAFLRLLKETFPALIGYVWKMEYGQNKSYHIHFMAIFNGNDVCRDVLLGKALGELWCEIVTKGDGGYWNCNAKKKYYERRGGVGIGMVAYDDFQKREHLIRAALYLTKVDYYVRLNVEGIGRVFGKGQISNSVSSKQGRRRKNQNLIGSVLSSAAGV